MFITNAGTDITACVTITALTGGEGEISNIVVPNGTPGYEIAPTMQKLGWRASDTRELYFDDVRLPERNLLGKRGKGFQQMLETLDSGRISMAAMGLGVAQGAYDLASGYAKERKQFGKPIAAFQAVQFAARDMATEIEAGRNLVYKAAWLKEQERPSGERPRWPSSTAASCHTARRTRRPDPRRVRPHGRVAISRLYRDQKLLEIGEGRARCSGSSSPSTSASRDRAGARTLRRVRLGHDAALDDRRVPELGCAAADCVERAVDLEERERVAWLDRRRTVPPTAG